MSEMFSQNAVTATRSVHFYAQTCSAFPLACRHSVGCRWGNLPRGHEARMASPHIGWGTVAVENTKPSERVCQCWGCPQEECSVKSFMQWGKLRDAAAAFVVFG